ncbi:sensor histidine kinase [Botryobacter ruber]|uniref:sensor histidine kinase n=1 Tax=Botryobacter ruber TaxID=2171629 RepID=UPI001F0C22B7|nr:histidine kinase [Botryobacter ruber]
MATVLLSVLTFIVVVFSFSIAVFWENASKADTFSFIRKNLLLVIFIGMGYVLYVVLKENAMRLYRRSENAYLSAAAAQIKRESTVVGAIWLGFLLLLVITHDPELKYEATQLWATQLPYAYVLYALNRHWLLPEYEENNRQHQSYWLNRQLLNYLIKLLFFSMLFFIPFMIAFAILHKTGLAVAGFFLLWKIQLLVMIPFSWLIYYANRKKANELSSLKKELGQTSANLDFLRSQINPHFLFNALNTLYGTALQENSERTAQGIQMLGDMMRFMLHENIQHKILLAREIEYMRNYIELQALRTSASPNIVIETKIEDVLEEKFIAPMLLIPFVENAFKHGISLTHKSWIKITLHYWQDKLYFDVYNSVQRKQDQDPEKNQSGVGLTNVKQRLALLYPNRHELVIRETAEEFFVHLTLQL